MRVTASLLPEPECNAIQEFVSASELIEHGFPVSSPSGVEPAGSSASGAASHNFQAQKTAGGNAIISSDYYCISPVTVSDNFQEFVSASELIEHGFPVSSPSGVEPAGSVASVAASSHMT